MSAETLEAEHDPSVERGVDVTLPDPERYRWQRLLGVGGMGEVHAVWDARLERSLALKRMRPGLVASSQARRRFDNERRVTAGLDHPGVVVVFDAGEVEGAPWYTMRLVDGHRSLRRALSELERAQGLGVVLRVAEALAFAHARGVIHRDVKPENLLLGRGGEVMVIDWGIARRGATAEPDGVAGALPGDTEAGGRLGTVPYLPPEQAGGHPSEHGPWSDVWSLGVVLWELVAGVPPLAQWVSGASVALPADLDDPVIGCLIQRCLSASADARPEMVEVARVLRDWQVDREARTRAWVLIEAADRLEPTRRAHEEAAEAHADAARARLAEIGPRGAAASKQEGWAREDAAERARVEAELADTEIEQHLQAALRISPGVDAAFERLAEVYARRAQRAEARGDRVALAGAERLLGQYDRGRWAGWLARRGRVTLVCDPPGVELRISRFELRDRRLVPELVEVAEAPLHERILSSGSYLAEIVAPGHAVVRYPFVVGRDTHWDGVPPGAATPEPIWLPPMGALGPEDVYVPAGWATLGDERAANGLARAGVWLDGFVIRRHPVRVREWIVWMDALAEVGRQEEAAASTTAPTRYVDGGHVLVPDEQGDTWDLDWPMVQIDWHAARAYAAWEAARTGQPWRLPWELEREKAARGVDGRTFPWGEQPEPTWFQNNAGQSGRGGPANVGQHPTDTSVYGMADAAGNVREWCLDLRATPPRIVEGWWRAGAVEEGPAEVWRVLRGGCWSGGIDYGRCGSRVGAPGAYRHGAFGVRLVQWRRT